MYFKLSNAVVVEATMILKTHLANEFVAEGMGFFYSWRN